MLTPPKLLQLSGPFPSRPQVVVSISHRADPASQSPGSVAHLWRVTSTNGNQANPTNRSSTAPIPGRLTSIPVSRGSSFSASIDIALGAP